MVPAEGFEPSLPLQEADFKSAASAISPHRILEIKIFLIIYQNELICSSYS